MQVNYTRSPIPQRAHIPGAQASAGATAVAADLKVDASKVADPTRRLLAVAGVDADAWLEGGVDLDSRAAVRELLAKAKPPLGTVARENAETACRWLTEGDSYTQPALCKQQRFSHVNEDRTATDLIRAPAANRQHQHPAEDPRRFWAPLSSGRRDGEALCCHAGGMGNEPRVWACLALGCRVDFVDAACAPGGGGKGVP